MAPKRVIFVCTSNTCRSPMAEGFSRSLFPDVECASRSISVDYEPEGSPANVCAVSTMEKHGIDITAHRSELITKADLDWADRIVCVTSNHAKHVREMFQISNKDPKVISLSSDVADPWNAPTHVYERCADQLKPLVCKTIEDILN